MSSQRSTQIVLPSVLLLFLIHGIEAQNQLLFRVSPGGETVTDGLWGGKIDLATNGNSDDLNTLTYSVPSILTASFDPVSESVLMEVEEDDQAGVLMQGTACADHNAEYKTVMKNVRPVDPANPYLMDSNCGWKCGWTAFTLYDSEIYFLFVGVFGQQRSSLKREISIRKLEGCESFLAQAVAGNQIVDFHLSNCSKHVSTVYSESFAVPNPTIDVWPAGSLTVVPRQGTLYFYLQVVVKSSTTVELLESHFGGATETLYSAPVESLYAGNFNVRSMGAIAYRDGVMCWTVAERLYCGLFHTQRMAYAGIVLDSGEVHSAGVCTGDLAPLPLGKIMSGIAIASTTDTLAIYFGCYPQKTGVGGVGLVKLPTADWSQKQLYSVKSAGRKVLGGSIFLADGLSRCPTGGVAPPTPVTSTTIAGTTKTDTTTRSGIRDTTTYRTIIEPCRVVGSGSVISSPLTALVLGLSTLCAYRYL